MSTSAYNPDNDIWNPKFSKYVVNKYEAAAVLVV